jgi:hypothetical protein
MPLTAAQAEFSLNGEPCKPVYKTGGYFVLIDLPEGTYRIGVRSALFQPDEFAVAVSYEKPFDERRDVVTVMMNPSPLHPMAGTGLAVRGCLGSDAPRVFYILGRAGGFKIAEDHAVAGGQQIKLFALSKSVTLPLVCLVNDKDPRKAEFVEVNAVSDDRYGLAAPLRFDHKRSTELIPMIRYRCGEDGSFFIKPTSVDGGKDGHLLKLFYETSDGLVVREVSVPASGEIFVGTV